MTPEQEAREIARAIEQELKEEFERQRCLAYNPNTKGYSYERALKEFLEKYIGSVFDLHTRAVLLDRNLATLSLFEPGAREFDIVGTHRTACPRIVLRHREALFIPLEGVAFVIEVAQTVDRRQLSQDLDKLGKLGTLSEGEGWGVSVSGNYAVRRPIKGLFYYEARAAEEQILRDLEARTEHWDVAAVLSKNLTAISPTLPIHQALGTVIRGSTLLFAMLAISVSLPQPLAASTWDLFLRLALAGGERE